MWWYANVLPICACRQVQSMPGGWLGKKGEGRPEAETPLSSAQTVITVPNCKMAAVQNAYNGRSRNTMAHQMYKSPKAELLYQFSIHTPHHHGTGSPPHHTLGGRGGGGRQDTEHTCPHKCPCSPILHPGNTQNKKLFCTVMLL